MRRYVHVPLEAVAQIQEDGNIFGLVVLRDPDDRERYRPAILALDMTNGLTLKATPYSEQRLRDLIADALKKEEDDA